jgi:hypothetical protein
MSVVDQSYKICLKKFKYVRYFSKHNIHLNIIIIIIIMYLNRSHSLNQITEVSTYERN